MIQIGEAIRSAETTKPAQLSPGAELRQDLDQIIAVSNLRRETRGKLFEERREKATKDLFDFNDRLRELSGEGALQFTNLVEEHQKDSVQRHEDLEKPMIDFKNESLLIDNLGKASSMVNLTEKDLPENLPPEIDAVQVQETLTAYLTHYLGFGGNPSGLSSNNMTHESIAKLMAMPNETVSQLFKLIKSEWRGKTPITEEEVAVWVDQRIKDTKHGIASAVSFRDKDDPNKIAPPEQKVNFLRDILMITRNPEVRKKFTVIAYNWYIENAAQRQSAQDKPMAVRIN